jgi:hypothetical protein
MSWKNKIKKAKYQGPPKKGSTYYRADMASDLKAINAHLDFIGLEIKRNPEKVSDGIKRHYEEMKKVIDKMDDKMMEQAKYGGNLPNSPLFQERDRRIDARWLGNYGAKYRKHRYIEE